MVVTFFLFLLAGCDGGGGEEYTSSDTAVQTHTLEVQASVIFPASSPLDHTSASVLCNETFFPLDNSNHATIAIATNKVMDVTLFLPSRDGIEEPTHGQLGQIHSQKKFDGFHRRSGR